MSGLILFKNKSSEQKKTKKNFTSADSDKAKGKKYHPLIFQNNDGKI